MPEECDNRDSTKRDSLLMSEADEPSAEVGITANIKNIFATSVFNRKPV